MEAKNKKDRKKARTAFLAWFSLTLLLFFSFGIFTLIIAQKGISMLEEKKARYDGIFRKQADYNFRMDEMYRNMHSLTIKERTGNEHRLLQQIITQERDRMLDEIGMSDNDSNSYMLYKSMLAQIRTTQETIDNYDKEARKRKYNLSQLQKGRKRLQ
ncbi:MAG: hypothetical protein D8H98_12630 [Prevotella sp.]|nr:MAG: hypothetical protein D8H98_12630 [Prevotella sp.]